MHVNHYVLIAGCFDTLIHDTSIKYSIVPEINERTTGSENETTTAIIVIRWTNRASTHRTMRKEILGLYFTLKFIREFLTRRHRHISGRYLNTLSLSEELNSPTGAC